MDARLGPTSSFALALASASGLALALAACGTPAPAPMPEAESVDLAQAGEGPITGTIDGQPFTAGDVRFRVETFEGRERIDLMIADRRIERCGLPVVRPETLVWARFPGRTALEPGLFERTADADTAEANTAEADTVETNTAEASTFEIHYERPDGRRARAAHRGLAKIEITRVSPTSIAGRLRICFADEARSCVGGTFEAAQCLSRIDGRAIREPPGLSDEALEPPREREATE